MDYKAGELKREVLKIFKSPSDAFHSLFNALGDYEDAGVVCFRAISLDHETDFDTKESIWKIYIRPFLGEDGKPFVGPIKKVEGIGTIPK
jgi:hypothetical protein